MSESSTHSPEAVVTPRLYGVPEGLQLASLDSLVGGGREISRLFDDQEAIDSYATFKEQYVEQLLADKGFSVDDSDPRSAEGHNFAKGIFTEVLAMTDAKWVGLPEGQDRTRRELVVDAIQEWYEDREDAGNDAEHAVTAEAQASTEFAEAHGTLDSLRDALAEITAKRQGKVISLSSKKYLRARRRYNEQLQKVGKLELADTLDDESLDSTEKNEAVIGYIFDEQAKLREKTTELLQGTKVGKFVEFMNKGNTFTRILKGAGVGVAAGLGGALVVGSGLAGAGVIAGAAVATGRFSRGFARSDAKGGRGMATTLDEDYRQSLQASLESAGDTALKDGIDSVDRKFAEDTLAEKQKRRKSVRSGVGAIALGGVIGAGVHLAGEMPQLFHPFGSDTVGAKPGTGTLPPTSPDATGGDLGGGETGTGTEGTGDPGRGEMFNGYQGSREFTAEGQKDFNEWISKNGGYEVKSGDSVWNISEKYLEANGVNNPTVYEVDAVKDSVLKELQAQGLADSRGWLSVGDTIKIK